MSGINKAVIPAAGLGTRLQPLTSYLPKAMLPLGTKPVLHHIVDELHGANIYDIAVVTRSEYNMIGNYFDSVPGIITITDDSAGGPGRAVMACHDFTGENAFLTIFTDAPVIGKGRGSHLKSLKRIVENGEAEAAVSIYRVPDTELSSRGIVEFNNGGIPTGGDPVQLSNIKEKPGRSHESQNWAATCRYVLKPQIYDALIAVKTDDEDELQLTTAIRHMVNTGKPVFGIPMPDSLRRHDTGNFDGYFKAFDDFAGSGEGY